MCRKARQKHHGAGAPDVSGEDRKVRPLHRDAESEWMTLHKATNMSPGREVRVYVRRQTNTTMQGRSVFTQRLSLVSVSRQLPTLILFPLSFSLHYGVINFSRRFPFPWCFQLPATMIIGAELASKRAPFPLFSPRTTQRSPLQTTSCALTRLSVSSADTSRGAIKKTPTSARLG